jgi:hypothetical protein
MVEDISGVVTVVEDITEVVEDITDLVAVFA